MIDTFDEVPRIRHWLDLENRKQFKGQMNLKLLKSDQPLKKIIATYELSPKVQCGISSCHTPHNKGFLVELCDGSEINVGHCCGKKYFGKDFNILKNKFNQKEADKKNTQDIQNFINELPTFKERYQNLYEGSGLKIGFRLTLLALIEFHDSIIPKLGVFLRHNVSYKGVITTQVEKTEDEIEIEKSFNPSTEILKTKEIQVDIISNYNLLFQKDRLYKLKKFFEDLFRYTDLGRFSSSSKNLKNYASRVHEAYHMLDEMEDYTRQASILFRESNISKIKIAQLKLSNTEGQLLDNFLSRYSFN